MEGEKTRSTQGKYHHCRTCHKILKHQVRGEFLICPRCGSGSEDTVEDNTAGITLESIAREALSSLIDTRDFLAYQLAHANGGMSGKELDRVFKEQIHMIIYDEAELLVRVKTLQKLLEPNKLDADIISTIFHCSVEQASIAIKGI